MDGKGLAILILLALIAMMLLMPQRSGFEAAPSGAGTALAASGPMISQGGQQNDGPSALMPGGAGDLLAPFSSDGAGMFSGGGFKIGQVQSDPNVGLIPKEVVTTEDFGQFSPDAILSGQSFLDPRAQIGFPETIGGNLRNANRDVRSEPPNPREAVSIFNLSTIPPDTMRPKFEIQNEYK
jgi:hypothetical protein